MSVNGANCRKDKNEYQKSVTDTCMREVFDDVIREWFPSKNGNFIVKLHDDEGGDDYDKAKSK